MKFLQHGEEWLHRRSSVNLHSINAKGRDAIENIS